MRFVITPHEATRAPVLTYLDGPAVTPQELAAIARIISRYEDMQGDPRTSAHQHDKQVRRTVGRARAGLHKLRALLAASPYSDAL